MLKSSRPPPKKDGTLLGFLARKTALVPLKAPGMPNIHAPKISKSIPPAPRLPSLSSQPASSSVPISHARRREPCQSAAGLLDRLHKKLDQIPASEAEVTNSHPLALFATPPESCVSGEPEDDWENGLNAMFHQAFGWGNDIPIESEECMDWMASCNLLVTLLKTGEWQTGVSTRRLRR